MKNRFKRFLNESKIDYSPFTDEELEEWSDSENYTGSGLEMPNDFEEDIYNQLEKIFGSDFDDFDIMDEDDVYLFMFLYYISNTNRDFYKDTTFIKFAVYFVENELDVNNIRRAAATFINYLDNNLYGSAIKNLYTTIENCIEVEYLTNSDIRFSEISSIFNIPNI